LTDPDPLLERWLRAVVATPRLTGLRDMGAARRVLLDDALLGAETVAALAGPIVDVGSGNGTPGIPLAVTFPSRAVTLLEAERRKCDFLEQWTTELSNLDVVWGRAESQPLERFGVAVAKALAPPAVAVEWCLPLVREGGHVVLWAGPSADPARIGDAAQRVGGELVSFDRGLILIRKIAPTPAGFPRRPGMARKRPLA
jgi:16S rRNA (guanine527-N7)-methyltransferase